MKKTSEHQQKMPLPSQWTMQMVSKYAINVQWSMVATGGGGASITHSHELRVVMIEADV